MVLISVIGDFITSISPGFFHFKDKIDTHIILSDKKEKKAEKFLKSVERYCDNYGLCIKNKILYFDEDSYKEIKKLEKIFLKYKDVYINTTDGLSFINTVLSYEFLDKANFVSYDIFENELIITNHKTITKYKCKSMSIEEHLILKGIEQYEFSPTKKYDKNLLNELFRNDKFGEFVSELGRKKVIPLGYNKIKKILTKMKIELDFNKSYKIITGDLFEYMVFEYLKEYDLFDDIKIGVKVKEDDISNEFDVLGIKDNHLYIIECKNKKINKQLDQLIYKYIVLRKNLDYDSKAFIISLDEKFSPNLELRANLNNVYLIAFKDIKIIKEML